MKVLSELKNAKKILVFNPSFIGDAVLTTPLVVALEKLFPKAKIDFCIRPESEPVFKNRFNTVVFDKRDKHSGIGGIYSFGDYLRQQDYDFVLSAHKSIRSVATLKVAGLKVYGFKESMFSSKFFEASVSRDMELHEVERNLMLLSLITENFSLPEAKELGGLPVTYLDEKFHKILLTYIKTISPKKIMAVNAGSTWATKRWPVEYFANLCALLHEKYSIVILGGPADTEINDAFTSKLRQLNIKYFDFANKISFSQIPAVIKCADLIVTNDSAPLHIAVSQRVPAIAIFGATTPSLGFAPYDNISEVCEIELDCRPCGLHGTNKCSKKHFKCMKDLQVSQVLSAVKKVMDENTVN